MLELFGCSLISASVILHGPLANVHVHAIRRGALAWLRAERIRDESNITAPDYEADCTQLVVTLRNVIPDLLPVGLLDAAAKPAAPASVSATRNNRKTDETILENCT